RRRLLPRRRRGADRRHRQARREAGRAGRRARRGDRAPGGGGAERGGAGAGAERARGAVLHPAREPGGAGLAARHLRGDGGGRGLLRQGRRALPRGDRRRREGCAQADVDLGAGRPRRRTRSGPCAPTPRFAPSPPPRPPPAVGPQPAYAPPAPRVLALASGIPVWVVERRELPIVTVRLVVRGAGSTSDAPGKAGLAGYAADLLDEGAGGLGAVELAARLERLGTTLKTWAEED